MFARTTFALTLATFVRTMLPMPMGLGFAVLVMVASFFVSWSLLRQIWTSELDP